jgi:hypothetical protein
MTISSSSSLLLLLLRAAAHAWFSLSDAEMGMLTSVGMMMVSLSANGG